MEYCKKRAEISDESRKKRSTYVNVYSTPREKIENTNDRPTSCKSTQNGHWRVKTMDDQIYSSQSH